MKTSRSSLSCFAALIGLDWSDGKHNICLQVASDGRRDALELVHTPKAIDEWARSLRKRFDGKRLAVALELYKGPIVYALRRVLRHAMLRTPSFDQLGPVAS